MKIRLILSIITLTLASINGVQAVQQRQAELEAAAKQAELDARAKQAELDEKLRLAFEEAPGGGASKWLFSGGYFTEEQDKELLKSIEPLIAAGANLNQSMDTKAGGRTLLTFALRRRAKLVVAALLKAGADVNYADENKYTPLHLMLSSGSDIDLNDIELLLKAGANINAQNIYGETPLMLLLERMWINPAKPSSERVKVELVKMFLSRGLIKEVAAAPEMYFERLPIELHHYVGQFGVKPLDLSLIDQKGRSTLYYAKNAQESYRVWAKQHPERKEYQEGLSAYNEIVELLEDAQKK